MKSNAFLFFFLMAGVLPAVASGEKQSHHKVIKLMGTRFEITAVHEDAQKAWDGINAAIAEVTRIEKLISSWDSNSQTSAINKNAGIAPVSVDPELFQLIVRSQKIAELTGGAFDISFASMDRIWKFDGTMTQMPSPTIVANAAAKINYRHILLDPKQHSVFLTKPEMKIGFGAIGKGYAANRAKKVMMELGITNGLVNAAGDLVAWGRQADEQEWTIGIADPKTKKRIVSWLKIDNGAIVTSGDYEKFVNFNGQRYSHIIDPRTGYPTTGIKSVSVICPDPELSDALATSIFVLGETAGLQLVNQLTGIECLIINDDNQLIASNHLELLHKEL